MSLSDEDIASAGELALGLLDKAETARLQARVAEDPAFADEYGKWSERMVSIERTANADPPAYLWSRIDAAVAASPRQDNARPRLRFWQGVSFASTVTALALAVLLWRQPSTPVPTTQPILVAAIVGENETESVAANYDPQTGALHIIPISLDTGALYPELWIIPEDGVARSLGVIDARKPSTHSIPQALRPHLHRGALFAITPEPESGAPEGKATGPVIAKGEISTI